MTAFKKYVKSKGFLLENDYPYMPYDKGNYAIEGVVVSVAEYGIMISEFATCAVCRVVIDRFGNICNTEVE